MCKIGVIDSGCGGISTLCALRNVLPYEDYVYVADKSHAPYGDKSDAFIKQRVSDICAFLRAEEGVGAVVIACNTATSAGIEGLRESGGDVIYVGVEPSIKPAIEELKRGKILILLTPATARQQKFLRLVSSFDFDKERLIIAPMAGLASLIESHVNNNLCGIKPALEHVLRPYKSEQIESIVLGCTHYCLISHYISDFFKAKIYDGNVGTALRLHGVLKQNGMISRSGGGVKFIRM